MAATGLNSTDINKANHVVPAVSKEVSEVVFYDARTVPIDPSVGVGSLRGRASDLTNSSEEPHTPRKNLGAEGLEIFTPSANLPLPVVDASEQPPEPLDEEQPRSDIHETTEKTNHRATLCFSSALIFTGVASYYLYRAVKERNFSLLIPISFWSLVATVIGTAGEVLQNTTKIEAPAIPHIVADQQENPYQEGQPIGLQNTGNTCFVNAPTQAIMNSIAYPLVFKQICERAKIRHSAFKKFLELYPSDYSYFPWARFKKSPEKPFALEDENMRHVLAMLSLKKSSLKYDSPPFVVNYPELYRVLGEFSQATKNADYASIKYDIATLNRELSEMKKDTVILKFFYAQREIIAKEVLGFEAYLTLIKAYEKAVTDKKDFLVLQGWISSPIGNVRNLLQGAEGASQEDVHEFLHCLAKYFPPEESVFFTLQHQQFWKECPKQDAEKIQNALEKHMKAKNMEAKNPDDILTKLPHDRNTISKPTPCCILKIEDPLTEGADGQKLLDNTLKPRNPRSDVIKSATVFLDETDQAKMFYPQTERFVIDKAPERVIIQLKRFEYTDDGRAQKKNFSVNMPEEIKIEDQWYELKSVVVHTGYSIEGGHYHAVVKKKHPIPNSENTEEKWWYASDSYVKPAIPADKQDALTKGYLYFYEKKAPLVIDF